MKSGEVLAVRYRLDARLGVGGMGEVWRATHTGTGREFAVKIMHAHAASSESARQRFAREAQASAKIKHLSIVDVFDVGELDDGGLYLAMELLDGVLLADALHAQPPLTVQDFLVIILGVTKALAAAHAVGIIHRDVKPANVFLHKSRETGFYAPKVLDFGVSKFSAASDSHATKVGSVLGSPRYMSPEQTRSAANVDPRTDIWSVGVMLFEGLTGTWPHEGDSFSSLVVAICTVPPASIDQLAPDLPESIRSIVRDCLKPVEQRTLDAATLSDRLEAALADPSLALTLLPHPRNPPDRETRSVSGVHVRPPSPARAIEPPSRSSFQLPAPSGPAPVPAKPAGEGRRPMPSMTEIYTGPGGAGLPAMNEMAPSPLAAPAVDAPSSSRTSGFRPVTNTLRVQDTGALQAHYKAAMAEAEARERPSSTGMRTAGFGERPSSAAIPAAGLGGDPPSTPQPSVRAPITFGAPPPLSARAQPSLSGVGLSPAGAGALPGPAALAAPSAPRSRALLTLLAVVLGLAFVGIVVALVLTLRAPP